MKIFRFYGYSDDTFGEYNETNIDFDNCGSGKPITFEIKADGKSLFITGQYSRYGNGCWGIDVAAGSEDNIPDWPLKMYFGDSQTCEYSAVLEVEVPDNAELCRIKR